MTTVGDVEAGRRRVRPAAVVPAAVLVASLLELAALATPFTWSGLVKPPAWPTDDKTINVYIETDPDADPPDRSQLLKEGMERWNAELADRGLQLNVVVGNVPDPPPDCLVTCRYKPAGSSLELDKDNKDPKKLGEENDGLGGAKAEISDSGAQLVRGEIIILDNLPGGGEKEKEFLRNLGAHEITHVLGLADDSEGEVTDHEQGRDPAEFNDHDRAEISTLYPKLEEEESKAEGEEVPGGETDRVSAPIAIGGLESFTWQFTYVGPPDGHVSLITLGIDPSIIVDVICPPGWLCLNPADPGRLDRNSAYYIGYNEDGHPIPPPWTPLPTPPVALRAAAPGAPLTTVNPTLFVTVVVRRHIRGQIDTWAGGNIQRLPGPLPASTPAIPALSLAGLVAFLLALAVFALLLLRRRKVYISGDR